MSFSFKAALTAAALAAALPPAPALAQGDEGPTLEHLRGNLYILYGRGGNIGVSAGEEGVFLIDDQFAPLTPGILAAIRTVSDAPVKFVLNTHWHGDHTGGNENLGKEGAVIVAHDNVRKRLAGEFTRADGRAYPPQPAEARPVITFNDKASVFINGEEARAIHVKNAHTDGDSIVWFKTSNLIHMGDLFFNLRYPYIDHETGGTIDGAIKGVEKALNKADAETIIIPGHGPVTDKAGLEAYHAMLTDVRARVAALKAEGKSLAEVQAANPTAAYDDVWTWNAVSADRFVAAVFETLP